MNLVGSSGNDVLIGNASAQMLTGGDGNDTLDGKGGADTLIGGAGNDTYIFGLGYGTDIISDYDTTSGNSDKLSFGTGITKNNLWFSQSGNDLVIDVLGTKDSVTISNWYSGSAYDLESFATTDGSKLDSQIAKLVSAMASYAANHTSFNPITATTMPTDTTLQTTIASAWHS
jgi:Ca2+-binding RTX toxin-like protein